MGETNDFDFLIGAWTSVNRRLTEPLSGATPPAWYEFPGHSVCRPFFGGAGSFEESEFPTQDFSAATVRLQDPVTGLWSIFWINSTRPESLREAPVVGRFSDGVGIFECEDTYRDRPIRVRYRWSDITADQARYEQSFSGDEGRTWEVNWISEFTRSRESVHS